MDMYVWKSQSVIFFQRPRNNMNQKGLLHLGQVEFVFFHTFWLITWKLLGRNYMGRVKRIWYLSAMWVAKVQASLRIRTVSPEPPLLAHRSSESRGTFRQKARSLAPLNGWVCAVKICHDGMLEDTNSLDGAHIKLGFLVQKWSASLISAFTVRMKKHWVLSYTLSAQWRLFIRLGRCPGWPKSSPDAQSFCWFCHEVAQMSMERIFLVMTWSDMFWNLSCICWRRFWTWK